MTGWMYDIAREQSPREDCVRDLLLQSKDAGYGGVGLYLEHRYAYPSVPWAAAPGSLTPESVGRLRTDPDLSGLRIIPFLNTLGHMEGFIRAEGGQWLAEGPGKGFLQLCPSRPECAEFAWTLVSDAMEAFDDEWVHLGGDEARQLGQCPRCAGRVKSGGVAALYGDYCGTHLPAGPRQRPKAVPVGRHAGQVPQRPERDSQGDRHFRLELFRFPLGYGTIVPGAGLRRCLLPGGADL